MKIMLCEIKRFDCRRDRVLYRLLHIYRRDKRACYLIFGVFVVGKELDSKDHEDGGSKLFRSVGKYLKTMMMMMMIMIIIIVIGPG